MYGVSEGPIRGWSSGVVLGTIAAGAVLLAVLVVVELRRPQPLIDLRLLGDRLFRSCNGVMLAGVGGVHRHAVRGLAVLPGRPRPVGAGLGPEHVPRGPGGDGRRAAGQPVAVSRARAAPEHRARAGRGDRLDRADEPDRRADEPVVDAAADVRLGVAMGQVFVPAQAAAFATISPEATGRASTMFNVGRQLGSAIGVAVLTTVIVAVGATTDRGGPGHAGPDRLPRRVPGRGRGGRGGRRGRADHSRRRRGLDDGPPRRPKSGIGRPNHRGPARHVRIGTGPVLVTAHGQALRGPVSSCRRLLSGRRVDGQTRGLGCVEQALVICHERGQ